MDREFDSQHVLEAIVERGHDYLVPKRKHTSEKAVARRLEQKGREAAVNRRGLHLGDNEWHDTTVLYHRKSGFTGEIEDGHERYAVFMSSEPVLGSAKGHIGLYNDRQEIEAGYKQVKAFKDDVAAMISELKSQRTVEGMDEVMLPGEPEETTRAEREENGIPLGSAVRGTLSEIADTYDLDTPWDG